MPRVKVGARGAGAVNALLDMVRARREEDTNVATERRKQRQRLIELGFQTGVKNGSIRPRIGPNGEILGFERVEPTSVNDSLALLGEQSRVNPDARLTQRFPGGLTAQFGGAKAQTGPKLNPSTIVGRLPLKEPAKGDALSLQPEVGGQGFLGRGFATTSDFTGRDVLGKLASAVMRDPDALTRSGSASSLISKFGLEAQRPQLELLAQAMRQGGGGASPFASPGGVQGGYGTMSAQQLEQLALQGDVSAAAELERRGLLQ
jgi:hypothetical protein